jgi:hypothetical protein
MFAKTMVEACGWEEPDALSLARGGIAAARSLAQRLGYDKEPLAPLIIQP